MSYARQVAAVFALIALIYAGAWLYRAGGRAVEAECAKAREEMVASHLREVERLQRESAEADARLRDVLASRKPVAPRIREIIRENPSDCRVPAAVDGGLRDAIRAANEAISARRG